MSKSTIEKFVPFDWLIQRILFSFELASKIDSNNLSIKGRGFYGSTNRNAVLPFEFTFTKE